MPTGACAVEAERAALVAALQAVGPSAPTLVGGWTALDLAAHVAATEQQRGLPTFAGRVLVARYGLRLNDLVGPVMAFDRRRFRRHGFDWAVARLSRPSPRLLLRPLVLPVSLFEVFVHHEDVRRANAIERQQAVPDLRPSVAWLLRYHRRRLRGVDLRVDAGDFTERGGDARGTPVIVAGPAGEVVMWLAGRRAAAAVEVSGDPPALAV